ncbi:hypothetical protein PsorP6_013451 [Peronosclerospora sorghi]|uniref:Uncharacterized protein n=1 Tax=Peronosclerospora sorghi TaxID=230839 RepID=A0ACC0VK58_9STRA|nr:hypothetical protein PsorP6_013451 [Peronosclerospora sorghi]
MSNLPINAVKFLGRDAVVATVGYDCVVVEYCCCVRKLNCPIFGSSCSSSQLRIWDLKASKQCPVTGAGYSSPLTTLETHPTRPELLITGADDGRLSFWDRRKMNTPFRTETYHQRELRALKIHPASPRYLYTGGDDALVYCWDFHHGRNPRDSVEYERPSGSADSHNSSALGPFGTSSSDGISKEGQEGLYVQQIISGQLAWNALAIHIDSDTLVAGSDAQSIVIVQHVSKWKQQLF